MAIQVTTAQFTVGLLYRGQIRKLLATLKMYGNIEDFTEVKRLLDSDFYIKGADRTAVSNFERWHREANNRQMRKFE